MFGEDEKFIDRCVAYRMLRTRPVRLLGLLFAFQRRCPGCDSPRVWREYGHHYTCAECRRAFTGYRVGNVHLAF